MNLVLLLCLMISFIISLLITPWWIKRAAGAGIVGIDLNKKSRKKVAEMGGIAIVTGAIFSLLLFIGHLTFFQNDTSFNMTLLGALSTLLLISVVGILDDILGWKIGIRQMHKPILIGLCALPMVMINSGNSLLDLPLIGSIDIGLLYPLIVIPIAISGAANGFNMLAGINGLETAMGFIIITYLSLVIWLQQHLPRVAMIGFAFSFALAAFYLYNRYPARVFPGNLMTFTTGAVIAILAILGNTQKLAILLFAPYFLEFLLKLIGGMQKQSFLKPTAQSLELPYSKIYSINHLICWFYRTLKIKVNENLVLFTIIFMELMLVLSSIFLF
ncbi:hypothetical protein K9M79_06610 [Candidatus Woesearchaeota archaeon]|nr:hypothetical protein [Candidatus Woesearchaeota archaeon]